MDVFPTLREVPFLGAPSGSCFRRLQIEVATRVIRPLQLDYYVLLQGAFLFLCVNTGSYARIRRFMRESLALCVSLAVYAWKIRFMREFLKLCVIPRIYA